MGSISVNHGMKSFRRIAREAPRNVFYQNADTKHIGTQWIILQEYLSVA